MFINFLLMKQLPTNYWRCTAMNGTNKPLFLQNKKLNETYYNTPNPYINVPSCNVNLLELSRYAKKQKKKLIDLTADEVKMFAI